jgi:protein-S-isoprenylcysteine O-methyltransferase Ste14
MSSLASTPQAQKDFGTRHPIAKRLIQVFAQFLMIAVILFVSAGTLTWLWAWVYIAAGVGILMVNAAVMPRELIAERGAAKQNVKTWDKWIAGAMLVLSIAIFLAAGLDERFSWSPEMWLAIHLFGLLGLVAGQLLFTWAMVSNKFFSTAVRIQTDRGQAVETGGPYRFVRHPGYVGYIVSTLATPLLLGSWWAMVPAALLTGGMIVRTALEDRTLQEELEGYTEYAARVRYRLVPGVW